MKTSNENLKMLLEERVLRLGDILNIITYTVLALKNDYQININLEKLTEILKSIPTLNKYIHLSDKDFAYQILNLTDEFKSEDLKNVIDYLFTNDEDFTEEYVSTSLCIRQDPNFSPKIVDFSKNNNVKEYDESDPIAYDFIEKMQSKIWNGIIDDLNKNMQKCGSSTYTVQHYDKDLINSLILHPEQYKYGLYPSSHFLKKNIINWAMVNNLIITEDDVNVFVTDKEVLISIESR